MFCSVVITFITITSALRRAEMSMVERCKGILSIDSFITRIDVISIRSTIVTHETRGFSLICVASHIGAISIIRRWICLSFLQVHVHCNICLDVGSLHSATGSSYLALAQNLTTVCTKKCRCSATETDPCNTQVQVPARCAASEQCVCCGEVGACS